MRRILYALLLTSFVFSCNDSDDGPSCPEGYFGKNCDVPFNTVFTGSWSTDQVCSTSGEENYDLTLIPSAEDPREFVIVGMWGESSEMITVLIRQDNKRKFSEGTQPLGGSGFTIEVLEGTINKAGDEIEIDFIIYSGVTQVETCTVSCTRNL